MFATIALSRIGRTPLNGVARENMYVLFITCTMSPIETVSLNEVAGKKT